MIPTLRGLAAAAVFGLAALASQTALASPASSRDAAFAAARAGAFPGETYTQYYRRGGGNGAAVAAGVVGGLAAGAIIGGLAAQAAPPPPPVYYAPPPPEPVYAPPPPPRVVVYRSEPAYGRDPAWVDYCFRRYHDFDPASGTYMAADGYRYPCR